MAITRVGLGGPSAAYLGFQPKTAQLTFSVPDVDETSILSRSPLRTIGSSSPARRLVSRNPVRTVESE